MFASSPRPPLDALHRAELLRRRLAEQICRAADWPTRRRWLRIHQRDTAHEGGLLAAEYELNQRIAAEEAAHG